MAAEECWAGYPAVAACREGGRRKAKSSMAEGASWSVSRTSGMVAAPKAARSAPPRAAARSHTSVRAIPIAAGGGFCCLSGRTYAMMGLERTGCWARGS